MEIGGVDYNVKSSEAARILARFHKKNYTRRDPAPRLRLYLGDETTGRAWGDVPEGYVSNSMGPHKTALLLPSTRSTGGDIIFSVVKIEYANKKNGGVLWQHSKFHL